MADATQAKLDILVNLAGSSPADAKALLALLKEVEKTEKAAQKEADRLAREIDKAAKAAERLAEKQKREQAKNMADMAREAEKVARELDKAEKAAARLEERNKRVAERLATKAQREADANKRQQAAADKASKREAERQESERQQQYRELQRQKAERIQRAGALGRTALAGNATGALSIAGGPYGMAAAAVVEGAEEGLRKLAKAAEIAAAANLTSAQRSRMVAEELLPFAASIYRISDALRGVSQQIFQRNQQSAITTAGIEATARYESGVRAAAGERDFARAKARALGNAPLAEFQSFDRGTVAGQQAARRQELLLPAQTAERSAAAEAEAARAAKRGEEGRLAATQERLRQLEAKRAELNRNLARERGRENQTDGGRSLALGIISAPGALAYNAIQGRTMTGATRNQAGINAAAASVQENEREIAAQTAAYAEQAARAKEAGARAAEAESAHRKAQLEIQRQQLALLREQENRMASMQQNAGAMSRGEFHAAARALRQVNQRGAGNVTAATLARAGTLAPDFIRAEREKLGGQRYDQLRGIVGAEGFARNFGGDFANGQTAADVRKQADKMQANVQVAIQMDEKQLADSIVKAIEPVFKRLRDILDLEIRRIDSEIRAAGVRQSNAANGGAR